MDPISAAIGAVGTIGAKLVGGGGGSAPQPQTIASPFDGRVLDAKNINVAPAFVLGNYVQAPSTPALSLGSADARSFLADNATPSGISTPLGSISSDVISGVIVGVILFILLRR